MISINLNAQAVCSLTAPTLRLFVYPKEQHEADAEGGATPTLLLH